MSIGGKMKRLNIAVLIGVIGLSMTCVGCQNNSSPATTNEASNNVMENNESDKKETVAEKSAKLIATLFTLDAPFTQATWGSTIDEIIQTEGPVASTYKSIYGGTTYVINKTYENVDGTVKYMFDDKDALMCVAFTYLPATSEEVTVLYNKLHSQLVDSLGKSEYQAEHDTNYGDVWYREEGDIVIGCMVTEEQNSLQYSYLNPIVSKYQMEAAAAQ